MNERAPRLTPHEIQDQLDWLFASRQRSRLVALWGAGDPGVVQSRREGQFQVVPAPCELTLRAELPEAASDDARMVFLVPWTHELPLDIAGRFVQGGRVLRVAKNRRLMSLFRVGNADVEAIESALAGFIVEHESKQAYRSPPGGKLTFDGLWQAWLQTRFGLACDGGLGLDTLLAWAIANREGESFVALIHQHGAKAVREELLAWLGRLDPLAPVVWRAWERGCGRTLGELCVLCEAAHGANDAKVSGWLETLVQSELGEALAGAEAGALVAFLAKNCAGALRVLDAGEDKKLVQAVVSAADARLSQDYQRRVAAKSTRLRTAWEVTCSELGERLLALADEPRPEGVLAAAPLLAELERHELFRQQGGRLGEFVRTEMALRLAAWLAARAAAGSDELCGAAVDSYAAAENLARWYVEQGGYVDWARRVARGSSEGVLGKGIQKVVAAADGARVQLDRSFARALVAWIAAGRPPHLLVGIEDAVHRFVPPFLSASESRRVLVLLFDGMGWGQAAELLSSLEEGSAGVPWGPLAWHRSTWGRVGESAYPPVLAALPTVTDVSRSAFFAGKLTEPGPKQATGADPKRWAQNPAVRKFFPAQAVPPLLLRNDSHTADGAASQAALAAVRNSEYRIVAVVINAIDAALAADPQQVQRWSSDHIKALHDLLQAARESGRVVLLASDHGHVATRPVEVVEKADDAASRWRPHSGSEPVPEYEVCLSREQVWAPPGASAVALLADDAHAYGSPKGAGAHGGATLAEVVVPLVYLGWEGLQESTLVDDEPQALRIEKVYEPSWWTYRLERLPELDEVLAPEPTPAKAKRSKPAASQQLSLPKVVRPDSVLQRLAESPVFAGQVPEERRELVLRALQFLMARDNRAPADVFAAAMSVQPFRIAGWVSFNLAECLNLEGYLVVRYDPAAKLIELDRSKLEQLFEVSA